MDKIGIVVLNYLNYEDTIECVESLLDLNYDNYEIVVVDNGSHNSSYKILNKEFNNYPKVYILNTGENLGYAKGNNFGIDFCREKLNSEHILVINNDTIAEDKKLLNILVENKNKGLVIGPKIINLNGDNQNPIGNFTLRTIFNNLGYYFLKKLRLDRLIQSLMKKNESKNKIIDTDNLILHGSCLFFTDDYFEYFNGFFSKTFLYGEELILYLLVKKANENLYYTDNTYIIHKEDGSSNMAFSNYQTIKDKYNFNSYKWFILLYLLPFFIIKKLFNI